MKLYRISQPEENVSYDTFDSAIVAAESEVEAGGHEGFCEWRCAVPHEAHPELA